MSCKKKHLCLSEFCCLYSGRFQAHTLPEDLQKFNMISAYSVRHVGECDRKSLLFQWALPRRAARIECEPGFGGYDFIKLISIL